ncbi:MAG TPA: SET domain-containing protein-lysine N-methyltransferase [Chthoniobacterales bacterium]|nr:SET domain-containing protein-lysine N-methyltransferase [Chthoniobacterales bacterium]
MGTTAKSNGNGTGQATSKRRGASSAPPIEVRESGIHGKGAFAAQRIRKGRRIIEYVGERMPWNAALEDPDDPHTFLFGLDDSDLVINAGIGGNDARWINHSCDPNCEAVEEEGRVFIYALRDIQPGEELFYDYALQIDEPHTPENVKQFQCFCGSTRCRGTLLSDEEDEE